MRLAIPVRNNLRESSFTDDEIDGFIFFEAACVAHDEVGVFHR